MYCYFTTFICVPSPLKGNESYLAFLALCWPLFYRTECAKNKWLPHDSESAANRKTHDLYITLLKMRLWVSQYVAGLLRLL